LIFNWASGYFKERVWGRIASTRITTSNRNILDVSASFHLIWGMGIAPFPLIPRKEGTICLVTTLSIIARADLLEIAIAQFPSVR